MQQLSTEFLKGPDSGAQIPKSILIPRPVIRHAGKSMSEYACFCEIYAFAAEVLYPFLTCGGC